MILKIKKLFKTVKSDSKGATAIEYGLLAALIAVAILLGVNSLSDRVNGLFNFVATNVESALSTTP